MPAVSFVRRDLNEVLKYYEIIRDCFAGEFQIKFRREKYLPRPNAEDGSAQNQARYNNYLTRAVFYNVTKRTLNGLVGLLFSRDPVMTIPDELAAIMADADGSGATLIQQAKVAARLTVGYGRCGCFIDFPQADQPISKADLQAGKMRPTIKIYEPWRVLNWRTVFRDGLEILSLVVLQEPYVKADDGFVVTFGTQWRVLQLVLPPTGNQIIEPPGVDPNTIHQNQGLYEVTIYRDTNLNIPHEQFQPLDADGQRLDTIPFTFIGAENNKANIDDAPLYDLAVLNVAHYRNSADYEESTYMVGQPTPYFTGLTENWVNTILKGTIQLGSRGAVPLPVGAQAGMLQAQPNSMVFEAMQHKEKQMVAIGANLIDVSKAPRTATETIIDDTNERSVLSTAGDNVSDAFKFALTWAARFTGASIPESPGIEFILNTDFDLVRLTAQERQELILEWQASAITGEEMRANFTRGGVAFQTLEEWKASIKSDPAPAPVTQPAPIDPNANPNPNSNTGGA